VRSYPLAVAKLLALLLAPGVTWAGEAVSLETDPVLARLVEETLAARPELRQAEASLRADRERVSQVGALPDPVLQLGIQNDGFQEIAIGKMETSYWLVMLSQTFPWPGKRGLRSDVARRSADEGEAALSRARLGAEGDVRRAYLDLLVARDRLGLLSRLELVWRKSADLARARYESGQAAQSDLLRAQLEQNRLRQRRFVLEAQEHTAVQRLDRLRQRPLGEPIATSLSLREVTLAPALGDAAALDDALTRSPELARARSESARTAAAVDLARRERFPDLTVSAGIMPRGPLDPMWQANLYIPIPVWGGSKQGRAVAEGEARSEVGARGAEAIEAELRLRVAERQAAGAALADTVRLYREGLLVQSRATLESTLAQYAVGRVTFASVLEANAGYVSDEEGHLGAVADAERLAIATREVSLDPVGLVAGSGGGGAIPGAGSTGGSSGSAPAAAAGGASSGAQSSGMAPGM